MPIIKYLSIGCLCLLFFTSSVRAELNSKEKWEQHKRSELGHAFQELIYGYLPTKVNVEGELIKQADLPEFQAKLEEHLITLTYQEHLLKRFKLLILKPYRSINTSILFLNKCGNHTVLNHPEISLDMDELNLCDEFQQQRGWRADFWHLETPLAQGLTIMTLHETAIAPDHPEAFKAMLDQFPAELINQESPPGMIAFWAWGLSRVIDYLEMSDHHSPIGLFGHSRRGKAALLAAALDPRVQFVIPHQSGTLGAVLTKQNPWESLNSITSNFPHWFTPQLQTRIPQSLTVDQDDLLALIAPRPLLITEGFWDFWASPQLSLRALNQALLIYRLYYPYLPEHIDSMTELSQFSRMVAHVQLLHGHTMHPDYWNVIAAFLKHKL